MHLEFMEAKRVMVEQPSEDDGDDGDNGQPQPDRWPTWSATALPSGLSQLLPIRYTLCRTDPNGTTHEVGVVSCRVCGCLVPDDDPQRLAHHEVYDRLTAERVERLAGELEARLMVNTVWLRALQTRMSELAEVVEQLAGKGYKPG